MAPSYSEQWDKNITTKIDVDTFWKEVKDTENSSMERILDGIRIWIIAVILQRILQNLRAKDM